LSQLAPIIYGAEINAAAVTTATDLFQITPVADRPVVIYSLVAGQTTDLGDAAEEILLIGLFRDVTAGSGGTAETEYGYSNAAISNASSAAVLTLNSSISTGGTLIDIIPWNIRMPLIWEPIPELRPKLSNLAAEGPAHSFRLLAAPTDSITVSAVLKWAEL
jgi:hypothetical protein